MKYTIAQFKKDFPDDDACLDFLFNARFGVNYACPGCGKTGSFHRVKGRKSYACAWCAKFVSPTAGTIFHKSDTSLSLWFHAIFVMSVAKNGVSAMEIERQVGVVYKTALRMAHKIRSLMEQDGNPFDGTFEADETYVGGRSKGTTGRGTKKAPVFGVMKRGGGVYAKAVPNVKRTNVMPIIRENVKVGSTINTDEYHLYKNALTDYEHLTVRHGSKEYVRGKAHTNTLEGFWSHVKGSIRGTHRHVSKKYLQAYLDQFTWTWNRRASGPLFGALLEASV